MNILLSGSIIGGCSYLVIRVMMKIDPEHGMYFSKKHKLLLVLGSVASALVCKFLVKEEMSLLFAGWIGVHIYFMIASMTDSMTCKVYDVFQYPALVSALLLVIEKIPAPQAGVSILVFALLQYFVFMRFFGAADGMAFLIASLAEASLGYDITMYLLHMIVAYLLLCAAQLIRKNVGKDMKLKVPVPFLPYIMISFWWILLLGDQIYVYM